MNNSLIESLLRAGPKDTGAVKLALILLKIKSIGEHTTEIKVGKSMFYVFNSGINRSAAIFHGGNNGKVGSFYLENFRLPYV